MKCFLRNIKTIRSGLDPAICFSLFAELTNKSVEGKIPKCVKFSNTSFLWFGAINLWLYQNRCPFRFKKTVFEKKIEICNSFDKKEKTNLNFQFLYGCYSHSLAEAESVLVFVSFSGKVLTVSQFFAPKC